MNTLTKRGAALFGVAALTLLAAGCGRADQAAPEDDAATSLSSGPATGTLTVWAMGAEGEALPAFAEDFEAANPDVDLQITSIPWASAHDKIQTAIAAGNGPDVIQVGTTWMADFGDAFAAVPDEVDTSGMFEGSVAGTEVAGRAVGVPWYVDTRVLYYRTDLAAEAGWDHAPATWDELFEMASDLQQVDGVDYGIRLPATGTDAFLNNMWLAWSNGASLTDADETEWTIDTPEMAGAFEYLTSFFDAGVANVDVDTSPGASVADFVSGSIPMFVDGPSVGAQIDELGGDGTADTWATAVLPTEVTATSFIGGSNLAVFKDSANPDAAWKLVQWLSEPDVQAAWYETTTDLPSQQAAWDDSRLTADPKLAAFGEQLTDAKAPPVVATWAQVNSAGETVVEQIARGAVSIEDGLAELQKQADAIGMG